MPSILSRLPSADAIARWGYTHRGKITGFLAGTLGTYVTTMFLVVAITGVPYDGKLVHPDRFVVYPNF